MSLVPLIVLLLVCSTLSCMQIKSLFALNVNAHFALNIKSSETRHYINEYSMLGQATGSYDKILGGKSLILIGDPGQLPPVGDKPLYHSKPSSDIGEQGYQAYQMFDKVVKLTVNQHVEGNCPEQKQFRELLSRLCKGESTTDDWKLLLSQQPSSVSNLNEFKMP